MYLFDNTSFISMITEDKLKKKEQYFISPRQISLQILAKLMLILFYLIQI